MQPLAAQQGSVECRRGCSYPSCDLMLAGKKHGAIVVCSFFSFDVLLDLLVQGFDSEKRRKKSSWVWKRGSWMGCVWELPRRRGPGTQMYSTKGVVAFLRKGTASLAEVKKLSKIRHVFPLQRGRLAQSIMSLLLHIGKSGAFEPLRTHLVEFQQSVCKSTEYFLCHWDTLPSFVWRDFSPSETELTCGFLKKSGRRWWPEMDFIFLKRWQPLLILFEFIKTSRPALVEKANCSVGSWPASVDRCFIYSKTSIPFLRNRHSVWIMWGFWQVFLGLCLNSAEIRRCGVMSVLPDGSSRPGRLRRQRNYGRQRERSSSGTRDCVRPSWGKAWKCFFVGSLVSISSQQSKLKSPPAPPRGCGTAGFCVSTWSSSLSPLQLQELFVQSSKLSWSFGCSSAGIRAFIELQWYICDFLSMINKSDLLEMICCSSP